MKDATRTNSFVNATIIDQNLPSHHPHSQPLQGLGLQLHELNTLLISYLRLMTK